MTMLPRLAESLKNSPEHEMFVKMFDEECRDKLVLSEKDLSSEDYTRKMEQILAEYFKNGKLWYRA